MSDAGPNPYESPQHDTGPVPDAAIAATALPEGFQDRSTALMLFGAFEIILGILSALAVPMMALSIVVQPQGATSTSLRTMLPSIMVYGLMAVVFVWLGIGSIQAKRWARALMLVLSWIWLVVGVLSTSGLVVVMAGGEPQLGQQGDVPQGAFVAGLLLGGGCAGCLYVVLPLIFILFYRSEHVKATCEVRDPNVRWTDRCPLPVLALVLILGFAAFSMLSSPAYNCVVPVFGVIARGLPGAVLFLVNMIVLAWLTLGTYRLKMSAWWGTLVFFAFWSLSAIITFSRVSMMEIYRGMDFPKEQMEMMQQTIGKMDIFIPWFIGLSTLVWLGYLIYVRKYFVAAEGSDEA